MLVLSGEIVDPVCRFPESFVGRKPPLPHPAFESVIFPRAPRKNLAVPLSPALARAMKYSYYRSIGQCFSRKDFSGRKGSRGQCSV
jgi:hypothetical protein